ncbi:hypothetical protein MJO28_002846 [Puccinia striiformis f. sp. tritici]|uniref:Uncharacterized protein n=1 Tax=Puccinia striiformis f. sp. tritici TaxID=168172 RepID=A0ACC0ET60_9BASI|nr:hypothetical protein MJO28_002846 [Puccinia striiformis f. sp. tritici]
MEVNSRATSLALRLGISTPVPLPVDCLTVPPTDQSSTDSREVTTGPETTYPSNQAPIVNKKQLEMQISSQELVSSPELQGDDGCVQELVSRSRDGHNVPKETSTNPSQHTLEHPRPPQHQQGLPAISHQACPTSNSRPDHRARRDWFHYNCNKPAAPQPQPPQQQQATPYPVQHQPQPGGNSGRSRRRRMNHPPQDNTARVLEVGNVFLRAERILGRMQRAQGRMNTQNRNHPNQHHHQ